MKQLTSLLLLFPLFLNAQDPTPRLWTNQQGRTVKAALVEVSGVNVVIQLENGTKSTVHVGTLSKADQDYLQKFQGAKTAGSPAPTGPLEWPKKVFSLDPKTIEVKEGVQDVAGQQFHYEIGNFEFISSAPLAKSVMSEVAADFLLTQEVTTAMPWGWEPRPKDGKHFQILLAETKNDYVKLFGGNDVTSSTMVNGKSLIMFSVIGLKKVGPRYQFDFRQKDPGSVTFITAYGMLYDLRGIMYPWTRYAYPHILERFAYQDNGSVRFSELESALKKYVKLYTETYKIELDLNRMIKTMRASNNEARTDARELNQQLHFDSTLLGYYFGFLDGAGNGSALHEYYRNILIRGKKINATLPPEMANATPEEMLNKIFAGRSDVQLSAEMKEKFGKVGVRFKD